MRSKMLRKNGFKKIKILMLKKIVAFTPLFGALSFPLIVPITISRFGVKYGILSALIISS